MLVIIQIPILDARPFLPGGRARLKVPVWAAPNLGVDFIRGWGGFKSRRRGGHPDWASEGHYCDASRAIRFQTVLSQHRVGPIGNRCHLACAFRRLYGSQDGFLRVEIGFTRRSRELPRQALNGAELLSFLKDILRVPIAIGDKPATSALTQLGPALASRYLQCTTDRKVPPPTQFESWLVQAGRPMLFVEYQPSEIAELPKFAQSAEVPGMTLDAHLNRELPLGGAVPVPAWYVAIDQSRNSYEDGRRLRINLLRRHNERECLRIMLQHLARGQLEARGEGAEAEALRKLLKRAGQVFSVVNAPASAAQSDDAALAFRLDDILGADDRRAFVDTLADILPNELRDQLQISGSQITITGSTVVNDNRISTGTVLGEHIAIGHESAA